MIDKNIHTFKRNKRKRNNKNRSKISNKIIKNKKIIKLYIIIILSLILYFISFPKTLKLHPIKNTITFFNHNKTNIFNGRIFYCTIYNNEAEMAYILIWRLYNYVDKFIIVISNLTHTGHSKNFSFNSFEENIKPYMDKIDIVIFDNICNKKEYPDVEAHWCREKSQRDFAKTFIEKNITQPKMIY